jgi:cytochrome c5
MNPAGRLALLAALAAAFLTSAIAQSAEPPATLAGPESFAVIGDAAARSAALFTEAGKVLTSARCVNCHPAGDRPLQGAAHRPHQPRVERGLDGFGTAALRCGACHQGANFDPAGVPGHPHWHLAPREMAWQDKTLGEICTQIKDPARNGGRSLDQILTHMATDSLVGWAWAPGHGREPAPGTQKQFGALIEAWIKTGAECPN